MGSNYWSNYWLIFFPLLCIVVLLRKIYDKQDKNSINENDIFEGENNLDNDAYKIFLTKKYSIAKNDALEKIISGDKLFDNVNDALNYAVQCEIEKGNYIKSKPIKEKRIQPDIVDSKCPNCDALVNVNDIECWQCEASFSNHSSWKPIPLK